MKSWVILAVGCVGFIPVFPTDAYREGPWEEDPLLSAIRISAVAVMGEYEAWANEWRKENRSAKDWDRTINLMAEVQFLTVQMAIEANPNPRFLEECLMFLGTTVPPELDRFWKSRILEMAAIDKNISEKVDQRLMTQELPSLNERAMAIE